MNNERYKMITAIVLTFAVTFTLTALLVSGPSVEQVGLSTGRYEIDETYSKRFTNVFSKLMGEYYKELDPNDLIEGAIAGMANSLDDRYTAYFDSEYYKLLNQAETGNYVGIGCSVIEDEDGILTVSEPYEGSPALRAGMKVGDKIIAVDGEDILNFNSMDEVIDKIRGPENTAVVVTVYRESTDERIDLEMIRELIDIKNVKYEMLEGEDQIGYIRIIQFDNDSAYDFADALNFMISQEAKGLVIDLRYNPGGEYNNCMAIADMLLPDDSVIMYTEDRNKNTVYEIAQGNHYSAPLALIVNGSSASASEVLTGTVKDNERGIIVGEKTFGKGVVTTTFQVEGDSAIRITTARYFTPSGVCIHEIGIMPDIEVAMPEEFLMTRIDDIPREEDIQLQTAIESVLENIK